MFKRIDWQLVCKFLALAFLLAAAILFYLFLAGFAVGLDVMPRVSGYRAIAYFLLFLVFFYLGFIRKRKKRPGNQASKPQPSTERDP